MFVKWKLEKFGAAIIKRQRVLKVVGNAVRQRIIRALLY
jgi:hypothetical protein